MKRLLALIFVLLSIACTAQTISPVISEYGKGRARGAFSIRNDSLQPETVTVEPRSFSVDANGQAQLRPLDATAHVQISATSARVSAGQQHTFDYDIRCDSYPCAVAMLTSIIGPHKPDGFVIRLVLSHTAYICEGKDKGCRAAALRGWGFNEK